MSSQDRIRIIKYCLGSYIKSPTDRLLACSDPSANIFEPTQIPDFYVGTPTGSYIDNSPFRNAVAAAALDISGEHVALVHEVH